MKIKGLQLIFDILRGKKHIEVLETPVSKWKHHHKIAIQKLREKYKNGDKIKVAFLMTYSSSTQDLPIFEKMLESDIFDPYIIVHPDVIRSLNNLEKTYKKTKEEMVKKYGEKRVLDGCTRDNYIDYTDDFDIMTTNSPYDEMAHPFFRTQYWFNKFIPIFYIGYFHMGRCRVAVNNFKMSEFSRFWRFFAENKHSRNMARTYQTIKDINVVVTGYPKLDEIIKIKEGKRERKRIIIAPHHTIDEGDIYLSGFLNYAEILMKLPEKYPEIDFIIRPHPMLITKLEQPDFWGVEKTKEYFDRLLKFDNMTLSNEGDYYELFVNSDGIMHDCGSFIAEYLCTGHPAGYLSFRPELDYNKAMVEFGRECMYKHYILESEKDIYNFIENVIINNEDTRKNERADFVNKELLINKGKTVNEIYDNIIKEIKN